MTCANGDRWPHEVGEQRDIVEIRNSFCRVKAFSLIADVGGGAPIGVGQIKTALGSSPAKMFSSAQRCVAGQRAIQRRLPTGCAAI